MGAFLLVCGLVVALLLPGVHAIVSAKATFPEAADLSVFGALMVYTAAAMLSALVYPGVAARADALLGRRAQWAAGLALLAILIASVATVTVLPDWADRFWFGYGSTIAALALLAIPIVIALLRGENRLVHILMAVSTCAAILFFYLPSILQPPWGLVDVWHSRYVLNEVLAPQGGGYPLVNFTAQYTSLFGYIFNVLFASAGTIDHAIWFLTLLAVAVVIVALWPLVHAFPAGKKYLALLFTVPAIFIVKANEDAYSGSISVLLSALPVRLIFAAVVASILATSGIRYTSSRTTTLLAFVCSAAIWNNLESGLVATLAAAMVLTVAGNAGLRFSRPALFLALSTVFLACEWFMIRVSYGEPDLGRMTAFVGGFGSGFGAIDMPSFGLWVFVFVFLSLGAIASTLHLRVMHGSTVDRDASWRLAVILLFWSAFGLGMSPYYINRSVVSGQLQFLLFPMFIAGAALLPLVASYSRTKWDVALLVVALPPAVSLASTIDHPSFNLALERLRHDKPGLREHYQGYVAPLREKIARISAGDRDAAVGLFTDLGYLAASELHAPSYLPVNSHYDFQVVSPQVGKATCALLRADRNRFVVSDVPPGDLVMDMISDCGYFVTDRFGIDPPGVTVFERRE